MNLKIENQAADKGAGVRGAGLFQVGGFFV